MIDEKILQSNRSFCIDERFKLTVYVAMELFLVILCGFIASARTQLLNNGTSCPHHCINTEVNITNEKVC